MRFLKALLLALVCLPAWSQKIDLATRVRGILPAANLVSGPYLGSQCLMTSPDTFTIVAGDCGTGDGGSGGGSVTAVSGLFPLFTTDNPSTVPTFVLSSAERNTVFGNCTASPTPPSYCSLTTAMLPDLSAFYAALAGGKVNSSVIPDLSATYAALSGGKVPTALLGSGTANSSKCLLGDQTWGACSTGTNNVTSGTIQGQVAVWDTSTSLYRPQAKPITDWLDQGVTTTGDQAANITAAWNAVGSKGSGLMRNGNFSIGSSISPNSLGGYAQEGNAGTGQFGSGTTFTWTGGASPAMNLDRQRDAIIGRFSLNMNAVSGASGIVVTQQTGTSGQISSHNYFHDLTISSIHGSAIGLNLADIAGDSGQNNEAHVLWRVGVTSSASYDTGTTCISLAPSNSNARAIGIYESELLGCETGYKLAGGSFHVIGGLTESHTVAMKLGTGSQGGAFAFNYDEGSKQGFASAGSSSSNTVLMLNNTFHVDSPDLTKSYMDYAGIEHVVSIGNIFAANSNLTKLITAPGSQYISIGDQVPNATVSALPVLPKFHYVINLGTPTPFTGGNFSGSATYGGITVLTIAKNNQTDDADTGTGPVNALWLGPTEVYSQGTTQWYSSPGFVLAGTYNDGAGTVHQVPFRFKTLLTDASGTSAATLKLLPPLDPVTSTNYGGPLNVDFQTNGNNFSIKHGLFTDISATGQITSTLATGTAPFVVASTTNVANLNASSLSGATFAAPGAIGGTTASSGAFTTVNATSTINSVTGYQVNGVAIASTNLSDTADILKSSSGTVDFSGKTHTLPVRSGTIAGKPATCTFTAGASMEAYLATDATAGQNWYFCTATNTWTQQLNTGSNSPFTGGAAGTSFQDVNEIAAPANPASGVERLYTDSTSHRFSCLRSDGTSCNPVATSAALDVITAAGGSNSINNGDNAQAWKWAPTTAAKAMFEVTENTAGTGGSGAQFLLKVDTLAASTAIPLQVTARGTANGVTIDRVTGTLSAIGSANINATQYKGGNAAGTGSCTNQVETADNDAAAPTCTTITSAYTSGTFAPNAHNLLSASHGDSTASSAVRGGAIFALGASPTWTQVAHSSATGGYWYWNGTDVIASTGAAAGTGTCTNQAVTAANADAAPTCTTITSAYVNNTVAVTGSDINTSSQVTATHLSAALPGTQGGTNNALMQFTGPATSLKTYTLPNQSDTIATLGASAQTFTNGLTAPSFLGSTAALTPNAAGGTTIGSNPLPWSSAYIGAAATNNIQLTGTATSAKVATFPDNTGTVAELNLAQSWSATQTFGAIISTGITGLTSVVTPNAAGGTTIGSNALPFSSIYIGGSATNNIQLTGTGTTAKVATLPDNTGTVAELNLAQTWTAAQAHSSPINPSSAGGTTNGTNALPWSSVYIGNAATNNIQLTGTGTSAKTATLPDNTGTIAELNLLQAWSTTQLFNGNIFRVTADFTTASSTGLQTITGLSFTLPANVVTRVPFQCELTYHQNVAAVAVSFGIQSATISPTNISARGWQMTSATAQTVGILATLTTTTATNIVSVAPSAITTNWAVRLSGLIDNPSNASTNTINIMTSQATAADTVTILKDSWCKIF